MLEQAQAHNFHFDAAQMPLNILDAQFRSFAHDVVPKLVDQGIAVLGMKPMSAGALPGASGHGNRVPALCAQPADLGRDHRHVRSTVLDQAFEAARTFKPLTETQLSALLAKTREAALSGKFETFKTTTRQDGTARNPQWMG